MTRGGRRRRRGGRGSWTGRGRETEGREGRRDREHRPHAGPSRAREGIGEVGERAWEGEWRNAKVLVGEGTRSARAAARCSGAMRQGRGDRSSGGGGLRPRQRA